MAHDHHHHSPGFLALVNDAKSRVRQFSIDDYLARVDRGEPLILVDTREDKEWARGHLPGAIHLGKGIIERDIEQAVGDKGAPIVCYCGGGFRSALVCDNLVPHERRPLDGALTRWMLRASDGYLVMSETVDRDLEALKPAAVNIIRGEPGP